MGHGNDDIEHEHDQESSHRIRSSIPGKELSVEVIKSERTVLELYRQHREGWLVLQSHFQREFVWTLTQQSRLVESILARIPLPPIYLAEEADGRMIVVDGQQRLTTLFRFLEGQFALENVELFPHLEGRRFEDLDSRLRRRFEATGLTALLLQPSSDPHAALHLFERLNQGGTALTAQEIRNALLQGPALNLIRHIADGPFRKVAGPHLRFRQAKADEFVLRGLAFLAFGFESYPGDMALFLDDALQRLNNAEPRKLDFFKERYLHSLSLVGDVFGETAFRRIDPKKGAFGAHINAALMDVEIWGFDQVPEPARSWVALKNDVRNAMMKLQSDHAFAEAISNATGSPQKVRQRFHQWKETLQYVAHSHP